MEAKEASLKDIVEREPHLLEVPFFQRKYVWEEENWEEMLRALENFKEEKVFWGSVIIKLAPEKDKDFGFSKGYIIDGQQRLTTIALLTKAIIDCIGMEDWCRKIVDSDLLFPPYTSAPKSEYQMIIRHSRVDREEFEYVIKTGVFDNDTVEIKENNCGQIMRCYAYYKKIFENKEKEELTRLADNLYGDEKVFVLISLDEKDVNEQAIFDSINRAGQKLYTSDIIKNNLFKNLMYLENDNDEVCAMCDTYWDSIFWTDDFWDEDRRFGNVGKSHLDFLLYSVACIKWSEESIQSINDNLESVYAQRTAHYSSDELKDFIRDISKYALIYKKYIYEFGENMEDMTFGKKDHVYRLLLVMDRLKIQMFYPYVLKKLYENIASVSISEKNIECDIENENLNLEAQLLEAYIIRRRICSASTSGYSKKCMEILKKGILQLYSDYKLENDDIVKQENTQIQEALKDMRQQDVIKIVLFCLELELWDEKDDMGKLSFHYQVEHIMPKKWKEYWPMASASSEDNRNMKIKEIGNMLLLSQKLNGHLQNNTFQVKMEGVHTGKNQKDGYRDKTQLKMTKALVDKYNAGNTVWDEKHIERRTEEISENVLAHWNIRKLMEAVKSEED